MFKRWKIGFILVIILSQNTSLCLAEVVYFQGFDDPNVLDNYDLNLPTDVSVSFSDQNIFEGDLSLHVISTNPSENVWIQMPLNIPFVNGIIISINYYIIEGIPLYWVILQGNTEDATNVRVILEYGNPGPYWHTDEIVMVSEFPIQLAQWHSFEIDLDEGINIASNTLGRPWDSFEPVLIEVFFIAMNPVWEPLEQRNVYFDNFQVWSPGGDLPPTSSITQQIDIPNNQVAYAENVNLRNLQFVIFGLSIFALILIIVNTVHYIRKQ